MKKNLFYLAAILMLFSLRAKSSHLSAGELTYRHIGNGNYVISVTVFRDCSGISLSPQEGIEFSSSCNNFSLTLDTLVTGYASTNCNSVVSVCQGGTFPAFQYAVYSDTVYLSPCADWKFVFATCCRNNLPINVSNPSGDNFYIESTLDNSTSENSSPVFSHQPLLYFPFNTDVCINNTAYDYDGDSLVYSLESPLYMQNSPLPYNIGFSNFDPFGIGTSMTFNPQSGNICKPAFTGSLGAYLINVKVNEFRNGNLIGSVLRDFQIIQLNAPVPVLSIKGNVKDSLNVNLPGITVELYRYNISQGTMTIIATDTTNLISGYSFNGLSLGQYMVKAIPVDTAYLPTYYHSTYYWNTGQMLLSICDTLITADVNLVTATNPLGTGLIDGYLNGLNIRSIDILNSVFVFLVDKNSGNLIAQTQCDTNSYYVLENVPYGEYKILVDIIGLNMASTHFPIIAGSGMNGPYNFIVNEDGIYAIDNNLATEVKNFSLNDDKIKLFPNPGNEYLEIEIGSDELNAIKIYNLIGETVVSSSNKCNFIK